MTETSISTGIITAAFGFLSALVGAVAQVYIAQMQRSPTLPPGPHAPPHLSGGLRNLQLFAFALLVLSLLSFMYVAFLPGEENRWFLRINALVVVITIICCAVLLLLPLFGSLGTGGSQLRKLAVCLCGIVFLVGLVLLALKFYQWQQQPVNVRLVMAGWNEYNNGNYGRAIVAADKCVDRFGRRASKLEADLTDTPLPRPGKVTEVEKEAIYKNGLLNDVATCYWIKGDSASNLHKAEVARIAFTRACELSHALTYDPKGFFWSPSADACDRLQDLK